MLYSHAVSKGEQKHPRMFLGWAYLPPYSFLTAQILVLSIGNT